MLDIYFQIRWKMSEKIHTNLSCLKNPILNFFEDFTNFFHAKEWSLVFFITRIYFFEIMTKCPYACPEGQTTL